MIKNIRKLMTVTTPVPREYLEPIFHESEYQVRYYPDKDVDQLDQESRHSEILIIGASTKINRESIRQFPYVKLIISTTSGIDHVDVEELKRRNILFFSTDGANSRAVAEFTLTSVLCLLRGFHHIPNDTRMGRWRQNSKVADDFCNINVGIWGYGKIGKHVAELCHAIGVNVAIFDRKVSRQDIPKNFRICHSLPELAKRCNILSIHVPLNEGTKNSINRDIINLMPVGSFLINTSRGEIINESDLISALDDKHLHGAVVDTWIKEPYINKELANHPLILPTPHIAWLNKSTYHMTVTRVLKILDGFYSNRLTNVG